MQANAVLGWHGWPVSSAPCRAPRSWLEPRWPQWALCGVEFDGQGND
jgi:hypothetical protein